MLASAKSGLYSAKMFYFLCMVCIFQTLQNDLHQFTSSIKQLDEAAQPVLNDINSDYRQLISETVTCLLSRLQAVQDDAAKHQKVLNQRREDLITYQVLF